jgi:hypothetical protein
MKKHVWIIEILVGNTWYPTVGCGLTKSDAEMTKRAEWKLNNPYNKFRVHKYISR